MALKAGTLTDFDNSMAKAMEDALGVLWLAKTGEPLSSAAQEDRRLMFIAIAQGVVKHLRDNAGPAFDVSVNVEQTGGGITSAGTGVVTINTTGTLY